MKMMILVYDVLTRVEIYRGLNMIDALRAQKDYREWYGFDLDPELDSTRIEVISWVRVIFSYLCDKVKKVIDSEDLWLVQALPIIAT